MNAIDYMLRQADYFILIDGTVTFHYQGKINKNLIKGVESIATYERVNGKTFGYSGTSETFSWGVTINYRRNTMSLTFNDYTIPMQQ